MMKRLGVTIVLMIGAAWLVGQGVQDSLLRTGRLAYQSGDYGKAIACYRNYLKIAEHQQDMHATADALRLIGDAFRASGEPQEALDELESGLAIATKIADSTLIGRIQNRVAAVQFEIGNLGATQEAATVALTISSNIHDQATVANTLNILGAAYRQAGNSDQALSALSQSVAILRELGDTTDIPNALNNMANTLLSLENYKAARDTAMHSFFMAKSMGILVYEQYAAFVLYKAYEGLGELTEALDWMETHMGLSTELHDQARSKEIASLRTQMEANRQEQENERLKTENSLQQQTIANQNAKVLAFGGIGALVFVFMTILGLVARRQRRQYAQLREQNAQIERQSEEIVAYNDKLESVARDREMQKQRLQEINQVKDKLFSIISHDLRSPLNSIQGTLQLLEDRLIDEQQFATMADTLKTRVDGTTLLLDNLLNWSRSQMDGFTAAPITLDIWAMAQQECGVQAARAKAKNIRLLNRIPGEMLLLGDKTMVELVLRNLISNAIKFTEYGGCIEIIGEHQGDDGHVGIQDNGVGIPVTQAAQVLGPEYFNTLGTAKERGSGLGLRLCREFLTQNRGQLWLMHNLDKGTTFWFSLPRR